MSHFEFYMSAFGDASPCDFTPLIFGSILDNDLKTIWDRMTSFTEYSQRKPGCRMQNLEFRVKYIDPDVDAGFDLLYNAFNDEGQLFKAKY